MKALKENFHQYFESHEKNHLTEREELKNLNSLESRIFGEFQDMVRHQNTNNDDESTIKLGETPR